MGYRYDEEEIHFLKLQYKECDPRTWPYYPIVMPEKDGRGPTSDEECD